MAALSAIKNQKNQRARQGLEDLAVKCQDGENMVGLEHLLAALLDVKLSLEEKEQEQLAKMRDERGRIPRWKDHVIKQFSFQGRIC